MAVEWMTGLRVATASPEGPEGSLATRPKLTTVASSRSDSAETSAAEQVVVDEYREIFGKLE